MAAGGARIMDTRLSAEVQRIVARGKKGRDQGGGEATLALPRESMETASRRQEPLSEWLDDNHDDDDREQHRRQLVCDPVEAGRAPVAVLEEVTAPFRCSAGKA